MTENTTPDLDGRRTLLFFALRVRDAARQWRDHRRRCPSHNGPDGVSCCGCSYLEGAFYEARNAYRDLQEMIFEGQAVRSLATRSGRRSARPLTKETVA